MRHRTLLLIAGLLLGSSACAHRSLTVGGAAEPQVADSLTLDVTNHFHQQVVVYARGRTQNYRLGTVDPGSRSHFVIRSQPWMYGPAVEFVARPTMSGDFRSGHLALMPGDVLDWDIQASLVHTRATIRP